MLKETNHLLPKVDNIVINPVLGDNSKKLERLGYNKTINTTKDKISGLSVPCWTKLRKLTNPLEYPHKEHTPKPISRAFFKLMEIVRDNKIKIEGDVLTLCEAPGGFIQALKYMFPEEREYYTFSLTLPQDPSVPVYNSKLASGKDVKILSNIDNKGDIYSTDNIKALVSQLSNKNITFVTADGGFCEINDWSNKEQLHHKIIFNQMVSALHVLKNDGGFVLKIFDVYTEMTFDFIYLLAFLFEEVYVCKPNTSRPTNSEKYLYCKGYIKSRFTQDLKITLQRICSKGVENYSNFIHKGDVKPEFAACIRKINKLFSDYQVYSINNILEIHKLNIHIKRNTVHEKEWVDKYY